MDLASHSPGTLGGPPGLCPSPLRDDDHAPPQGKGGQGNQRARHQARDGTSLSNFLRAFLREQKAGLLANGHQKVPRKSPMEMSVVSSHEA